MAIVIPCERHSSLRREIEELIIADRQGAGAIVCWTDRKQHIYPSVGKPALFQFRSSGRAVHHGIRSGSARYLNIGINPPIWDRVSCDGNQAAPWPELPEEF